MSQAKAVLLVLDQGDGTIAIRAGLHACVERRMDIFELNEQQIAFAFDILGPGIGRIVMFGMPQYRRRSAQLMIDDDLIQVGLGEGADIALGVGIRSCLEYVDPAMG